MKDNSSKRNHFSIIKQTNEMSNWYLFKHLIFKINIDFEGTRSMAWFLKEQLCFQGQLHGRHVNYMSRWLKQG